MVRKSLSLSLSPLHHRYSSPLSLISIFELFLSLSLPASEPIPCDDHRPSRRRRPPTTSPLCVILFRRHHRPPPLLSPSSFVSLPLQAEIFCSYRFKQGPPIPLDNHKPLPVLKSCNLSLGHLEGTYALA
ncbi:hypothetical protein ACSBR2_027407 [Camellia fascicularis]